MVLVGWHNGMKWSGIKHFVLGTSFSACSGGQMHWEFVLGLGEGYFG
jgi:hypothetical protein